MWCNIAGGFALLAVATCAAEPALAQAPRIGQIDTASGTVSIVRSGGRVPARAGDPVYQNDVVETGADGSVGITLLDKSRFSTGPDSQLAVPEFRFDTSTSRGSMLADLRKGTLTVQSGDITHNTPGAMHIKTPTAILGVRGTKFGVQVEGKKELFVVFPNSDGTSGAVSIGAVTPGVGASAR